MCLPVLLVGLHFLQQPLLGHLDEIIVFLYGFLDDLPFMLPFSCQVLQELRFLILNPKSKMGRKTGYQIWRGLGELCPRPVIIVSTHWKSKLIKSLHLGFITPPVYYIVRQQLNQVTTLQPVCVNFFMPLCLIDFEWGIQHQFIRRHLGEEQAMLKERILEYSLSRSLSHIHTHNYWWIWISDRRTTELENGIHSSPTSCHCGWLLSIHVCLPRLGRDNNKWESLLMDDQ